MKPNFAAKCKKETNFKISKIYTPSHRSKFQIFANNCQAFSYFCSNFCKAFFRQFSSNFKSSLIFIHRNFVGHSRNCWEILKKFRIFEEMWEFLWILIEFWVNSDVQRFEWFGRSRIESFNPGLLRQGPRRAAAEPLAPQGAGAHARLSFVHLSNINFFDFQIQMNFLSTFCQIL